MSIGRQNIIDLIGKNRSKYSSCVITSYTFDFTYFEARVLPALRTANIKNVNIFVDGNRLDRTLEQNSFNVFKQSSSYSVTPVYEKGAFHPKIMMLTGPKHGLLIIGSGNLTSSGISTNDEIWGAFHMNSIESQNISLIVEAWRYLEGLFSNAKGFNQQKLGWIYSRSPWIKEMANIPVGGFTKISDEREVAFIGNTSASSSFNKMLELLPADGVKELNIISPYFDSKGVAIDSLNNHFKPEVFTVITDTEFGLLPNKISEENAKNVSFYDWKDCLQNFDSRFNRLHAKMFQFKYADGSEYLMLGSANATIAALGNVEKDPINAEAGFVLRRKGNTDYFDELGVSHENANPINVLAWHNPKVVVGDFPVKKDGKIRITHAELNGEKLRISFKEEFNSDVELVLFSSLTKEEGRYKFGSLKREVSLVVSKSDNVNMVALEVKNKRVSNLAIVHNVGVLSKCNPDPNHTDLNNLMTSLEENPDGDEYIELLKYADYNWVEDETSAQRKSTSNSSRQGNNIEVEKEYETIDKEGFDTLQSAQQKEQQILDGPNTQIADVLEIISRSLRFTKENVKESAEQSLLIAEEDNVQGEGSADEGDTILKRGRALDDTIKNHLKEIRDHNQRKVERLKKYKLFNDSPKKALTINDCSHMSVAIYLLYLFYDKYYSSFSMEFAFRFSRERENEIYSLERKYSLKRVEKVIREIPNAVIYEIEKEWFPKMRLFVQQKHQGLLVEQEEYTIVEDKHKFLTDGMYNSRGQSGVKKELIESLGAFLISANTNAGFKHYAYEALNDKITSLRKVVFEKGIYVVCSMHWMESEKIYRNLLLLNLLNFVNPVDVKSDEDELIARIKELKKTGKEFPESLEENLSYFQESIVKPFVAWKQLYGSDRPKLVQEMQELKPGDIVYRKDFGFCSVNRYKSDQLEIVSPGLDWSKYTKSASISMRYPLSKIIVFRH